jgi:hypothetical protein
MKTFHFENSKVYGKLRQQKAKVNFIYQKAPGAVPRANQV